MLLEFHIVSKPVLYRSFDKANKFSSHFYHAPPLPHINKAWRWGVITKMWSIQSTSRMLPIIFYMHRPHTTSPSWAHQPQPLRHMCALYVIKHMSDIKNYMGHVWIHLKYWQGRLSLNTLFRFHRSCFGHLGMLKIKYHNHVSLCLCLDCLIQYIHHRKRYCQTHII